MGFRVYNRDASRTLAKTRSDEDVEGKTKAFQDAKDTAIKETFSGKDLAGAVDWAFEADGSKEWRTSQGRSIHTF